MRSVWIAAQGASRPAREPATGPHPWVTQLATLLLIAVTLSAMVAGRAAWQSLAETAGLRSALWAWDDPASYPRLVSYQFIHGSVTHFYWNTMVLLLAGSVIERRVGAAATAWTLIGGGVVAALAHLALFPEETRPLIGASGAVAALLGMTFIVASDLALTVRLPFRARHCSRITLRHTLFLWIGLQTYAALHAAYLAAGPPPVAYWSHLAGFAAGMIGAVLLCGRAGVGSRAPGGPAALPLSAGD